MLNFFGIGFKINRKSGYELSAIHSTYFMSEEKGVKLSYFTTSGLSTYYKKSLKFAGNGHFSLHLV